MVIQHALSQEGHFSDQSGLNNVEVSPVGNNLFTAESKTTARTTTVNQFEAENEKIVGGDADETWYASLLEHECSHNWMHLLTTIDLPEKRGTHMVKDESSLEGTIVPLRMIDLVKHDKKFSSALPVKPNL